MAEGDLESRVMTQSLFPALDEAGDKVALRFGSRTLTYAELLGAFRGVGALLAGVPVVPINPKAGERELEHILGDSSPELVLCAPGVDSRWTELRLDGAGLAGGTSGAGGALPPEPGPGAPAIVVYTSGTTGPPKGAVLPRRGGGAHHIGRFSGETVAAALAGDATMLFAVPTMYHRLAAEASERPEVARALAGARLLVSGPAGVPAAPPQGDRRVLGH